MFAVTCPRKAQRRCGMRKIQKQLYDLDQRILELKVSTAAHEVPEQENGITPERKFQIVISMKMDSETCPIAFTCPSMCGDSEYQQKLLNGVVESIRSAEVKIDRSEK